MYLSRVLLLCRHDVVSAIVAERITGCCFLGVSKSRGPSLKAPGAVFMVSHGFRNPPLHVTTGKLHGPVVSLQCQVVNCHSPNGKSLQSPKPRSLHSVLYMDVRALSRFPAMRVSEEPVCIYLFRQNPVFTSLHLRSQLPFMSYLLCRPG